MLMVRRKIGTMQIPEACLQRLLAAGLLVGHPFPANHLAWPEGRTIGKPETVRGNSVIGYRARSGLGQIVCDAPAVFLPRQENLWVSQSGSGRLPSEWYRAISAWS
jgi:hypothetical protein